MQIFDHPPLMRIPILLFTARTVIKIHFHALSNYPKAHALHIQSTLEVEGTLWNTSRYPYFDISDVQTSGKYQSNNQISQINM